MTSKNIKGSIFGTACGDMVGLPYEGLKPVSNINFNKIGFFGNGFFSDDTEHTVIVAQCLIESHNNPTKFKKLLKRRLQFWLLSMPIGIGYATLKGILKSFISLGGVYSAGNGPAMRSALIGLVYGDDNEKLKKFIEISTTITHTDKKSYFGALAVAKASFLCATYEKENIDEKFLEEMKILVQDKEFIELIENVINNQNISTKEFSLKLGFKKGVSGYIYHTLPIVLHSWLKK